jgi:hypothetical protein
MPNGGAAGAHLRALAGEPRGTGTDAAAGARRYCSEALRALEFSVRETPFEYSALPGRWGTPLGGVALLLTIGVSWAASRRGLPGEALASLVVGAAAVALGGRWLACSGVLDAPLLRRRGVNLEATRGPEAPLLWLVAHTDSKSQPVPLVARAAGIVLLALAWMAALIHASGESLGHSSPAAGNWILLVAALGSIPVIASVTGNSSAGAVDNASGVATVLAAATLLPPAVRVGVLLTDAEELGLAGARHWSREHASGVALNCDSVDDTGELTLLRTPPRGRARRLEQALRDAAALEGARLRAIALIPGVLVDGVALADAGWETITVSRGTLGTLSRIHTSRDSLDALRGEGVAIASRVLARAALSLTEHTR